MKISSLKEDVLRRAKILKSAYEYSLVTKSRHNDAVEALKRLGGDFVCKRIEAAVVVGKFLVSISITVIHNISNKSGFEDLTSSNYNTYISHNGNYCLGLDLFEKMNVSELDAFKSLKKNLDDFIAGKIDFPYPYKVRDS